MAVKTLSSPVFHNFGDTEAVSASVTSITDGDTLDAKAQAGFGVVHNVIVNPTTAVLVTAAISGSTITFKVASGTPTAVVTILGR